MFPKHGPDFGFPAEKAYDVEGKPILIPTEPPMYDYEGNQIKAFPTPQEQIKKTAPYFGRLAVEALPVAGSFVPGMAKFPAVGLGAVIKNTAKAINPELFGEAPQTPEAELADYAKEIALNVALPWAGGKAIETAVDVGKNIVNLGRATFPYTLRFLPAVRNALMREYSQRIQFVYPDIIKTLETAKPAELPTNSQQYKFLEMMKGLGTGETKFSDLSKEILSDPQSIRNFNKITNMPHIPEQVAIDKLLSDAAYGDKTFNGKAILEELSGPSKAIYSEAIHPQTLNDFKGLAEGIAAQQNNPKMDYLLKYSGGRLMFALPGVLFGGKLGTTAGIVAGTGGAYTLTNYMMGRLMRDPETANLVIHAIQTPVNSPQARLIGTQLGHVIAGLTATSSK